ncbi:MAG: hypothetical protein ABIO70_16645 [Pseudomonadota bacterium]
MSDPLASPWAERVLGGDLCGVDPREELEALRGLVNAAAAADRDLRPLFLALRELDPIALADLAVGPRAPRGPRLAEAALVVLEALESQVAPGGLYRRLVGLAGPRRVEVLIVAAARHPTAGWLVALSDAAGEQPPGRAHLEAAAGQPGLEKACREHVAAGHHTALIGLAGQGHPEAVAALVAAEAMEPAREAAARLLEVAGGEILAPWVAAVWGPEPDGFYLGVLRHLRSVEAAVRLEVAAVGCPRTLRLLATVRRGLRPADA